jgi:hypothetical protein
LEDQPLVRLTLYAAVFNQFRAGATTFKKANLITHQVQKSLMEKLVIIEGNNKVPPGRKCQIRKSGGSADCPKACDQAGAHQTKTKNPQNKLACGFPLDEKFNLICSCFLLLRSPRR